jgi:HEAT repeats
LSKKTTEVLARRAVFETSPEVRKEAVKQLARRPTEDVRPILLTALRHPWERAADHAAEALVTLDDREAIPALEKLLKEPNPCEPTKEDGKWVRQELVRANHLRNCLLCHPPSGSTSDLVRGPVPTPGEPLPVVYYEERSRLPSVRADITFLRQDFSVTQRVASPDKWPEEQRFDFLVRKLPLTDLEVKIHETRLADPKREPQRDYPQRQAVAWALEWLKKVDE